MLLQYSRRLSNVAFFLILCITFSSANQYYLYTFWHQLKDLLKVHTFALCLHLNSMPSSIFLINKGVLVANFPKQCLYQISSFCYQMFTSFAFSFHGTVLRLHPGKTHSYILLDKRLFCLFISQE